MAVIFSETTLPFSYEDGLYVYAKTSDTRLLNLSTGDYCEVIWDGDTYTTQAKMFEVDSGEVFTIGDASITGLGEDTSEPFLIMEHLVDTTYNYAIITTLDGESHTIAINTAEEEIPEEPAESVGVTIKLYDRTGEPVTYETVETLTTDTPDAENGATFTYGVAVENAEYTLDFTEGNQKVSLEKGQLLKEFTMVKPENLLPEYIKKNIEVAGVVGEFAGDEAEKTVDLNMTDGDQVIETDEDTVMTKVTVRKPETLVPENITDGVNIGGVVGTNKRMTASLLDGTDDFELIDTMFDSPPISLRSSCFYSASTLTRVSLSQVTRIPVGAFGYCSELSEVYMPNCTRIDNYAFQNCKKLTSECMTFGELSYTSILAFSGMSNYSYSYPDGVYTVGGNFIIAVDASMKSKQFINFDDYSEVTAM